MRIMLNIAACLFLGTGLLYAQQPPVQDQLLDHLTGVWILRGTIAGKQTIHDVSAKWVLGHHYVMIHEVSREKNAQGLSAYEAMPFVGWNPSTSEYVCAWFDTYGGMSSTTIGPGKRTGDEIHFIFKDKDSVFHNHFVYHKESDSWEWLMDSEEKGGLKPFARVKLTRK